MKICSAEIKNPPQGPWILEEKRFFFGKLGRPGSPKILKS